MIKQRSQSDPNMINKLPPTQVLNTRYQVPSTWYQALSTWYQVPSTWHQVQSTWYQVPSTGLDTAIEAEKHGHTF